VLLEASAERRGTAEAALTRDFGPVKATLDEQASRVFDNRRLDERPRTHIEFLSEQTQELATGDTCFFGQLLHGPYSVWPFQDEVTGAFQRGLLRGLHAKRHAQLALVSGALHIKHQVAGDAHGKRFSVVFLDQGETEIESGSGAGGSPKGSIPHEQRFLEPPRLSWRLFGLSHASSATACSASCL
jgi:hypothetical protein